MLRYNDNNGAFLLYTNDVASADAAGLSLSTSIRGPAGEKVYFTADHSDKPDYNPYAVLEFYDEADETCRARLDPFMRDYRASWADNSSGSYPAPPGHSFLDYQRAGIDYALRRKHCLIGDAPGLGKTIEAIGIANAIDARSVLIVCPASIRRNWRRELHEWSTIPRLRTNSIESSRQGVNAKAHYNIISYDLMRNHGIHAALRSMKFDLAVFDEAHYLKTLDAKRTRAIFGGGEKPKDPTAYSFYQNGLDLNIEKMLGLTGTFLPNRPREAYTLGRGFDWEAFDYLSHDAFNYRFNSSVLMSRTDPLTGEEKVFTKEVKGRLPELNARMRCNFMVRRLKEDVLEQLPDKRYEMTYVDPNGAIKDVLAREALIDFDPRVLFNPDFTLDGTPISTLRREMGEAMIPRMVEYIRYMMDIVEHEKLIVFGHHRTVLGALMEILAPYHPVLQMGGMSDTVKERALWTFVQDPRCRLFLGQLDTMEGVDGLQSVCSHVVLVEPAWTSGRNEQCVDRAHRIGQHDNVVAHFLLVEGSFNEMVLNAVLVKHKDIHASMDRRIV